MQVKGKAGFCLDVPWILLDILCPVRLSERTLTCSVDLRGKGEPSRESHVSIFLALGPRHKLDRYFAKCFFTVRTKKHELSNPITLQVKKRWLG